MKGLFIYILSLFILSVVSQAQNLPVVIEAESGVPGSDYKVLEENSVRYVTPDTDMLNGSYPGNVSKIITYNVQFTEPGAYHFYAKIRVGTGGYDDDSYFLARNFGDVSVTNVNDWYTVNGLAPVGHTSSLDVVTGGGNAGTMVWKWVNISRFINAQSPVVYIVDSAENPKKICIGAREDGFDIDKIAFAKADLEYTVSNLELVQAGSPIGGFPDEAYRKVKTYVDPVFPGAYPDMTLMRVGDSFYSTESSFHLTPYVPIYHSTDLVHWEVISRVVSPGWTGSINDTPSGGIWQGALAEFGGYFWVYYSINSQQHFSRASSMTGPWTEPTRVTGSTVTGYDNSIFVDDDGTPYMLMKNGKFINRMQKIDKNTGQLTGPLLNLDWINADGKYSWAEGPVMCKRDGWYYYFIAGNVGGGQWVLRTPAITDSSQYWQELGTFFLTITDAQASFRAPNHSSQPVQSSDGTWWALSHSFESVQGDDWSGKGRQGLLHQVLWDENGRPAGTAPTSKPRLKPELPKSGIPWNLPRSDFFDGSTLNLSWNFLNRTAASRYSLSERSGWLTLKPGNDKTHILHKEGGYYFTLVTRLDFDATTNGDEAGLYFTNGNESVTARVYSSFTNGKKIGFRFNDAQESVEVKYEVENIIGNVLWLKVERDYHQLKGFYSTNGVTWTQIGSEISVTGLDKSQPSYNWWIGTNNGLFAAKKTAYFDMYLYRDGFSGLPAIGHNNHFGVEAKGTGTNKAMTNTTEKGGWLMMGGVSFGPDLRVPVKIEVEAASANSGGTLEVWVNDIEEGGAKIAEINITNTGSETSWEKFSADVPGLSGQYDLYLRWNGSANAFLVKKISFDFSEEYLNSLSQKIITGSSGWKVYPNPVKKSFTVESDFPVSIYKLYNIEGILIETGKIEGNSKAIGIEKLLPGTYLLELISGNNRQLSKLNKVF